jgi:hypothetical protein
MNNWDIRKLAIVESDDFQDKWDRNGLNILFYWKAKYPKFKISLFTIPNKTSSEFRQLISRHSDWIELCVHGWDHDSNFECYGWDYETAKGYLHRTYTMFGEQGSRSYKKIFKAPGWTITPTVYPAAPEDALATDPQAVYKAMVDTNFVVVDRHYNAEKRPEGLKCICIDCNPDIVHMHTWNMMTPDPNERNGFEQVEARGVPWDGTTEFKFLSEAWEEGLILPCKK